MRQFILLLCSLLLLSTAIQAQNKILFITSNQTTYGDTNLKTSNHFAEIVLAYDVLINAGYVVDFVSPDGGAIPIGYIDASHPVQKKYIDDAQFQKRLRTTKNPSQIAPSQYAAVYYTGGGAAMFGVPENKTIQHISESIYRDNGIVSAVCHGTAGIVNLRTMDSIALYANKKVSGFPDKFERKTKPYYQTFPFSIEEMIKSKGGDFVYSEKGWDDFVVVSDRLITGQDPSASASVAKEIIKLLQSKD